MLYYLLPPVCFGCGRLRAEDGLCTRCTLEVGPLERAQGTDGVFAEVPYEGPWAHGLHRLKYHGERILAGPLGRRLRCSPVFAQPWDAIVPIPLHPYRQLWRGFNQVELLLRHARVGPVQRRWLRRVSHGPALATLPAAQRRAAVRGAFAVAPRHHGALQGRRVLLVDDVVTTGATLDAARRTLLAAGAAAAGAVALMRTITPA